MERVFETIENIIKDMPETFQDDTRKKVMAFIEKKTKEDSARPVSDDDIVQAFLESVPFFAHKHIIESMKKAGISEQVITGVTQRKTAQEEGKETKTGIRNIFAFKKIIKDYPHAPGVNCAATSTANILKYLCGLDISEDMVFGLGNGIFFDYYRDWKDESPDQSITLHISGMTLCVPFALEALGIRYKVIRILENGEVRVTSDLESLRVSKVVKDRKKALFADIKEKLRRNIPILFLADGYYLRVFPDHFGLHHSVVIGYDEARGIVYLADSTRDGIYPVNKEDFYKSRISEETFVPPLCAWFEYEAPKGIKITPEAILSSIKRNSDIMLGKAPRKELEVHPKAKKILRGSGIRGMKTFVDEILMWPDKMTKEEIAKFAAFISISIEHAGAGNTFYRKAYANFLTEAAALLKNDQLSSLAQRFYKVGEAWNALSKKFLELRRDFTLENLQEARQMVLSIHDQEFEIFSELNELSGVS